MGKKINRKYGWKPDIPDFRDFRFRTAKKIYKVLDKVDLREKFPPVYDQGELGSCTANAIAGAIEFGHIIQKLPNFSPSRLFIYYNEREMEGTIGSDSGAQIRDGIKSVARVGACAEKIWPYIISKFIKRPTPKCYKEAKKDIVLKYQRLIGTNLNELQYCLTSGFPFVFGMAVYDSFESEEVAKTGIVPMPNKEERVLGGHAVLAVGYDNKTKNFIVRNSWGSDWGLNGYFMMPFEYLTNSDFADDFWTIKLVQ